MPREEGQFFARISIVKPNTGTPRDRKLRAIGRIRNITRNMPLAETRFGSFG